jgi:hypothetical protein
MLPIGRKMIGMKTRCRREVVIKNDMKLWTDKSSGSAEDKRNT